MKLNSTYNYMTLIEIMVVMALIGMISAVLLYNVSGSLQKGKMFSTEYKIKKLEQILLLHIADGEDAHEVLEHWEALAKQDPLLHGEDNPTLDAWGKRFTVTLGMDDEILVTSEELTKRKNKQTASNAS